MRLVARYFGRTLERDVASVRQAAGLVPGQITLADRAAVAASA